MDTLKPQSQPQGTIDFHDLTIADYHAALLAGTTTTTALITFYLTQITTHNPTLNALISINPTALSEAATKDTELETSPTTLPPLHGVPILLKDTYTTACLPTTSGLLALKTLQTPTNAPVVTALLSAGAIILGKANLHEFSLEGVTLSSLQGQTLNPYDATRTPGGSSGGTAAALAANMALAGCGGDTMNSLRSPASACGVVGFRPTRGQVSRTGVVPVSETQDVVGPMGRCVRDVRAVFGVMRGEDVRDAVTVDGRRDRIPSESRTGTASGVCRVGIVRGYFGDEDGNCSDGEVVNAVITQALHRVQENDQQIELVELPALPEWDISTLRATADTQPFEFRTVFDKFLQSLSLSPEELPHQTLASIVESGEYHHEAVTAVLHQTLEGGKYTMSSPEYQERLQRIDDLKCSVEKVFREYALDAVVYPHQRQLVVEVGSMVQPGRNGLLAALSGRPAVCFPAGFSPLSETAKQGIPIGIELMGQPWMDDELLDLAERFEKVIQGRRAPVGF